MAFLYRDLQPNTTYHHHLYKGTHEEYLEALKKSSTLYVGNLSFYTTEEQIWELFSKVGEVKRIIMGLNRRDKTPCGFCFVEFVIIHFNCILINLLMLSHTGIILTKLLRTV